MNFFLSCDLLKSEVLFIEHPPHAIYVQNISDLCKCKTWNSECDFKNQLIKTTKIFTHVVIKKFQKKLLKQPNKQPNKW